MDDEAAPLLSTSTNTAINSAERPPPYYENDHDRSILSKADYGKSPSRLWKRLSFFVLPVEAAIFLYVFGVYFQMQVYQQYYYQRIFRIMINDNQTNESDHQTNSSIDGTCLYQDLIVNLTSPDSFVKGQREINDFSMFTTIAYLLPSILVSPLIGTLSDQIGRKPSIAFVFVGQCISAILSAFIVYFELNLLYFFIGSFLTGVSGGFGIMFSSGFAYVTDVTSKKWLTVRMACLEASIFVATAVSSASSDTWIEKTNCSFKPQVWLPLATSVIGLIYSLIIPESLDEQQKIKTVSEFKCGFHRLVSGFKLFFCPSYIGLNVWKIWIIVIVTVLSMINETGNSEISAYFLENKPLEWTYTRISSYLAVTSVSHMLALLVLLPILVVLKFPDSLIGVIGLVVSCVMNVYVALLTTTVEMFTVGVIIGVQSIVIPSLRAILARLLKQEDRGAAFSLLAMFQLLATLIATIVFNQVYTPEDLDNKRDNPRVVYWMAAGIWGLAVPILCLLLVSDIYESFNKKRTKSG